MKLGSGMSGGKIVDEYGPKWRNSVRAYLKEVGSCLNADMKAHIRLMLDSGKSALEILGEFGPKWQASVKKYLDEVIGEEAKSIKNGQPPKVCNIDPRLCNGALRLASELGPRVKAI